MSPEHVLTCTSTLQTSKLALACGLQEVRTEPEHQAKPRQRYFFTPKTHTFTYIP